MKNTAWLFICLFAIPLTVVSLRAQSNAKPPYQIDAKATQTTASGLKYQVVEVGKGPKVVAGSTVSVHYHGMLENGTVFDSSIERGEPITFPVGQKMVIAGWEEGLQLLNEGSKAILTIPANLAYGERAQGKIPANSTLIFHIEVVKVQAPFKPFAYKATDLKTTPSGLKYTIVRPGSGDNAKAGQRVKVHYHGTLTDGTKFDSSFERGQPFEFNLGQGQVIKGWDEGIALLNPGAQAVLEIPSNLAYGDRGAGGVIKPGSTLIFYVELVGIQ